MQIGLVLRRIPRLSRRDPKFPVRVQQLERRDLKGSDKTSLVLDRVSFKQHSFRSNCPKSQYCALELVNQRDGHALEISHVASPAGLVSGGSYCFLFRVQHGHLADVLFGPAASQRGFRWGS